MPYKILIDKTGSPKLVEVPEKPELTKAITMSAYVGWVKEYEQALSTALADKSKHIEFTNIKQVQDLIFHQSNGEVNKFKIGQTFDLPPNIGVSFEYQLKDGGGWKDITHRHYLNSFPEHRRLLAILTPITEAPIKSEGEENWQTVNPNQPKYAMSTNLSTESMPVSWIDLWCEIENWYGDHTKKETAEQLLTRLQKKLFLTTQEYSTLQTQQLQNRVKELEEQLSVMPTRKHQIVSEVVELREQVKQARNEGIQECIEKTRELYSHSWLFEEFEKLKK